MSTPNRAVFGDDSPVKNFIQRHGAIVGAAGAGLLALVLLVVALGSNGSSSSTPAAATSSSVVVAKKLIHRGSRLDSRAAAGALTVKELSADDVEATAVASIADVRGKVATSDILPGEQVTAGRISTDTSAVVSRISGSGRGVTLPIDAAHGMVGDIVAGDRVDVYASFDQMGDTKPVLKEIARNIEVLRAPGAIDGAQDNDAKATAQITLELPTAAAQRAAFSADHGKVWVVARPAAGAKGASSAKVTLESLLAAETVKGSK